MKGIKFKALTWSLGCQSYAVPAKLNEHIDLVYPGTHFSRRPSPQFRQEHISTIIKPPLQPRGGDFKSVSPPSLVDCDEFITPACLRVLYSIHYTPVSINNNSFGVGKSEFLSKWTTRWFIWLDSRICSPSFPGKWSWSLLPVASLFYL